LKSVLFVCLGNICRSPLAQGIFEHKVQLLGCAKDFDADSAGTSAEHRGERPHRGSIAIAQKYDFSIEKQRSRPVHTRDKDLFDYIVAMDTMNYSNLISEFRFPKEKVFLMRDFSLREPKKLGLSVPDPWGYGSEAFEAVYSILDDSIDGFIAYLRN